MPKSKLAVVGLLASFFTPMMLSAEEVRYYRENGVDYRETTRTVSRPVSETRYEERERTVYREEYSTEVRESTRIVHVPVTEYRWEAQWRGRWNPFGQPYLVQQLVPRTHWEIREEKVSTPVTQRQLVPETRVVRVPITERFMAKEEITSRVALSPRADGGSSGTAVARRQGIGGVQNLQSDPPRSSSDSTIRR